jgi:hypothetical protein
VAGRWTQALGHLQIAYLEGCRHPLCLRWLAVTYLSNGQLAAAAPVLEAWRQVEPGNAELRAYSQALAEALSPPAAAGPAATAEADRRPKQIRLDTARSPAAPPVAPPAPSASPLHIGPYASPQTTQRA